MRVSDDGYLDEAVAVVRESVQGGWECAGVGSGVAADLAEGVGREVGEDISWGYWGWRRAHSGLLSGGRLLARAGGVRVWRGVLRSSHLVESAK